MIVARRWITGALGFGVVVGFTQACILGDPQHCANSGDPCAAGQECDPCTPSNVSPNGCVDAGAMVDLEPNVVGCQAGDGATSVSATVGEESTDTSVDPTTMSTTIDLDTTATDGPTDTTATTGTPPMCDAADGTYLETCPANAPFCVEGSCTPCTDDGQDTTCSTDEGAPGNVCDDGACVECSALDSSACGGATPICDEDVSVCMPCTTHDQCPGEAGCHLFEGSCLPSDRVFYVELDVPNCDTAGNPYCDIVSALTAAGSGMPATIRVGGAAYLDAVPVVITSNAVVAILGNGDVDILGQGGSPGVTVNANGVGYLAGVTVQNISNAPGVQSAGDLRMDDAAIRDADIGLASTAGLVYLQNVRVINNAATGISVSGTDDVTLRNVIVAGNGTGTNPRGFVTTAATPFAMVYTTIVDNAGSNAGAVNCIGEATRSIRNSILVSSNYTNSVNCGSDLTVTYSMIADPDYEMGEGNVLVTNMMDQDDLLLGADFEVGAGTTAEDVALWIEGDPPFDINGSTRPTMSDSPDTAGANRP